jgi:hypothetical protein
MPLVILHHLLNVSVQLANKRGFTQKKTWGLKDRYLVLKIPALLLNLSQIYPILTTTSYFIIVILFRKVKWFEDRLSDLVSRVSGYKSRGPGSISGSTRFSEK